MTPHWHHSIENVAVYGLSAIIVINLLRIGAGHMVASNNQGAKSIGKTIGALVQFG